MRYNHIRRMDISNGPGYRVSLFTQGCFRKCRNCFSKNTWDPSQGTLYDISTRDLILNLCDNPHVVGLSILGGEPLLPENLADLYDLLSNFRTIFPNKNIWMWTGYEFKDLSEEQRQVVDLCDVLIAGPYNHLLHDIHLKYAGSSNQVKWVHSFQTDNWYSTFIE